MTTSVIPMADKLGELRHKVESMHGGMPGHPEAFIAVARAVQDEWGYDGYLIEHIGGCLFRVYCQIDGARFYLWADRYGNTTQLIEEESDGSA